MPIKDPDKKRELQKQWNEKKMSQGYGRALYARRKKRFENEKILREAIEKALSTLSESVLESARMLDQVEDILVRAIEDAPPVTGKPLDFMPE